MYFSGISFVLIEIRDIKNLLLDLTHIRSIFDLALDNWKLSESMLLDVSFFLTL